MIVVLDQAQAHRELLAGTLSCWRCSGPPGSWGYRTIAAELGLPADTVRGWILKVKGRAEWLRTTATSAVYKFDANLPSILPTESWSTFNEAISALGATAAAAPRPRCSGTTPSGSISAAPVASSSQAMQEATNEPSAASTTVTRSRR